MLGRDHALSGLAAGAAAGELAHLPVTGTLALVGLTAAFATLPDIDTGHSCCARALGPLSEGFAFIVEKVSGGHRHGSHSILGVAAFTGLAMLAAFFRHDTAGKVALAAFLLLAIAAGLRALRIHGHLADVAGLGAASAIAVTGRDLVLVPVACALGCLTHIAGDMLTVQGCPLAWPFTLRHFRLLPSPFAFTTGTLPERAIVAPALLLALGYLTYHAIPR